MLPGGRPSDTYRSFKNILQAEGFLAGFSTRLFWETRGPSHGKITKLWFLLVEFRSRFLKPLTERLIADNHKFISFHLIPLIASTLGLNFLLA